MRRAPREISLLDVAVALDVAVVAFVGEAVVLPAADVVDSADSSVLNPLIPGATLSDFSVLDFGAISSSDSEITVVAKFNY